MMVQDLAIKIIYSAQYAALSRSTWTLDKGWLKGDLMLPQVNFGNLLA